MNAVASVAALACAAAGAANAARCTTTLAPGNLDEYQRYVAAAEERMPTRFQSGELAWVPAAALRETARKFDSGKAVRWNISDAVLNQKLAPRNATIIHWAGAVRLDGVTLPDVRSVLEDYENYARIYAPMIFECTAPRTGVPSGYDVTLGLYHSFRFASLFPQHYSFRAKGRIEFGADPDLRIHLRAGEIRESDSGVPGRNDLMEPFHDHGIMWALNAYWRGRTRGTGVYLEFETITLARSVQAFVCRLGFLPVPKAVVTAVMDSVPGESVETILEGARAECERRFGRSRR
jgi:hypothetical protein